MITITIIILDDITVVGYSHEWVNKTSFLSIGETDPLWMTGLRQALGARPLSWKQGSLGARRGADSVGAQFGGLP